MWYFPLIRCSTLSNFRRPIRAEAETVDLALLRTVLTLLTRNGVFLYNQTPPINPLSTYLERMSPIGGRQPDSILNLKLPINECANGESNTQELTNKCPCTSRLLSCSSAPFLTNTTNGASCCRAGVLTRILTEK